MATDMQSSEKLVLKLASRTEKYLPCVQRIGTFRKKSHRSHIESGKAKFYFIAIYSLMYMVFEKRLVNKKNYKNRSDRNQQKFKN